MWIIFGNVHSKTDEHKIFWEVVMPCVSSFSPTQLHTKKKKQYHEG